ncbi:hypothetical protein GK107_14435 [Geobacillus thermoleovorans]|uniref:hypothetical protein n=1 Tax=Geobacillus thermoleovorans TaxID=33941 RepID=UPI00204D0136|nr:hypothetical protein [Geobacillus thermoleovorans]UPT60483.1 hypothetical protein GK107_14435 [Geobacillus thermoleovorans]
MRKVKEVIYYEDRETKELVIEYADAFLICDGLALSLFDGKVAVLEKVKPSEMFPGYYEATNASYMQFDITKEIYDHIMRNYENMSEIELLNTVVNCA